MKSTDDAEAALGANQTNPIKRSESIFSQIGVPK
jgi:hypothetical protein